MANISFANLKQNFDLWREEIDNHATDPLAGSFTTKTVSDHIVTLIGTGFGYQNGVPRDGHVDGLLIKLGGVKEQADIVISDLDRDFYDFALVVSAPTTIDRTIAMWSAALAGNDSFDFGADVKNTYSINIAGDGYEAPDGRAGGDDSFIGNVFESSVVGDFMSVGTGCTASGGNDHFALVNAPGTALIGDVGETLTGSRFVAGNDTIIADRFAYIFGDAVGVDGQFQGGDDTILGGDENDQIVGDVNYAREHASIRFGHDLIHGGDGDDIIAGDVGVSLSADLIGGNDTLFGDGGNDSINGNAGDDFIRGGEANDTMIGGSGTDAADYHDKGKGVEIHLDEGGGAVVKVGGIAEDKIDQFENLIGGAGSDKFFGLALSGGYVANRFDGRAGNDTLNGGGGRDTLIGGAGKDKLTGGTGSDQFRFEGKLGNGNVDKLTDFRRGTDKLALDDAIFEALGTTVEKAEFAAFAHGHVATKGSQHLLYDKSNGTLWYDADGKGGHAAVQFAQLGTAADHPTTLSAADVLIV